MRATLDTNVYVSACIVPSGVPDRIIAHWRAGRFELAISDPILSELDQVLTRHRIARYLRRPQDWIAELRRDLRTKASRVDPEPIEATARDLADDPILGTALAAKADYLVSGDRDLLDLGSFRDIPIVTPRRFLETLDAL